ncbi:MAG: hypothetical protein LUE91_01030 [Oscillospiraceae bacterium]|nr:hypothetical protein [Oscillospiraceae bacterium]
MMRPEYSQLKECMEQSKKTVAVTGAGISYLYGMRRLKQSVGRMNAGRIFSSSYVRKNPEKFYAVMKDAFLDATFVKGPSTVHKQLAELERQGKLCGIVTQNLDCLHTVAGSKNVIEFQGSFRDNVCIDCGERCCDYQVWNQGHMPRCEKCGAPLMPAAFCRESGAGSDVSRENMRKAADLISQADLVLVIGTTGFRSDEYLSRMRAGTKLVQINPSATQFDQIAGLNIRADAAEALDAVLNG